MNWILLTAKMYWALLRLRWIGFRLRRRTGIDLMRQADRAQAASERAEKRALLIDPTNIEAAKRAGLAAFKAALDAEPRPNPRRTAK